MNRRSRSIAWQKFFEEGVGLTMAAMFSAGTWFVFGYLVWRSM